MVMSGSHYPTSSFPSQEIKEEAMGKYLNADNFVNEENLDTHDMNPSSFMGNLEFSPVNLDIFVAIHSLSLTNMDQECFSIVGGLFSKTSCSKNSCDFILSYNHDYYMLKYFSDSYIMQEKKNHADHFTKGEEINI